jgi:hypothetical protein
MAIRDCKVCGVRIHPERIEIIPNTQTCTKHSSATARVGFMDYSHKTAPQLVMVNSDDKEGMRRAINVYRRKR